MSTVSQIVRSAEGLAPDIIQINDSLADIGPPSENLGVNGNTYIDTASGIQYQKKSGVWVAVVDIAAVGPPASVPDPLTINNGLFVNNISGAAGDGFVLDGGNVGDVQVLIGGGQAFQVGQPGSLDNVRIQNNGNVLAASKVQGFELEAAGGSHLINIKNGVSGGLIENQTGPLEIKNNAASGINVNASAGPLNLRSNVETSVQDFSTGYSMVINPNTGFTSNSNNSIALTHVTPDKDINVNTAGTGSINLNSAGSLTLDANSFININSTMNWGLNDVVNADRLQGPTVTIISDTNALNLESANAAVNITSAAPITLGNVAATGSISIDPTFNKIVGFANAPVQIENFVIGQGITLKTNPAGVASINLEASSVAIVAPAGAGSIGIDPANNKITGFATQPVQIENFAANQDIILRPNPAGSGSVVFDVPANGDVDYLNSNINNLNGINGSSGELRAKSLCVIGGVMQFRETPRNIEWFIQNAGANNTFYGGKGLSASPADFGALNLGPGPHTLTDLAIRANYNVPWTWGGGTAVLTVGVVLNTLPSIAANYTPLYTLNLNTAGNFYAQDSGPINITIPPGNSFVCRLVTTGTSSTSNQIDMTISAILY